MFSFSAGDPHTERLTRTPVQTELEKAVQPGCELMGAQSTVFMMLKMLTVWSRAASSISGSHSSKLVLVLQ